MLVCRGGIMGLSRLGGMIVGGICLRDAFKRDGVLGIWGV